MKVRPSVKPICEYCKVIRRNSRVMVICPLKSKHKQRQDKIRKENMARIAGLSIPNDKRVMFHWLMCTVSDNI